MNSLEKYVIWIDRDSSGRIWMDPEIKPDEQFLLPIFVEKDGKQAVVDAIHFRCDIEQYPNVKSYIDKNKVEICREADKQFAWQDRILQR